MIKILIKIFILFKNVNQNMKSKNCEHFFVKLREIKREFREYSPKVSNKIYFTSLLFPSFSPFMAISNCIIDEYNEKILNGYNVFTQTTLYLKCILCGKEIIVESEKKLMYWEGETL